MAVLNLKKEPYHLNKVSTALRRRGMRPDFQEEWEIHGPHEGMNYQVYVGYAVPEEDPSDLYLVSITLHGAGRGVYELDTSADWYKSDPERRIECTH